MGDPPVFANEGTRFDLPSFDREPGSLEHPIDLITVQRTDGYAENPGVEPARRARTTPHETERWSHNLVESGHGREDKPSRGTSARSGRLSKTGERVCSVCCNNGVAASCEHAVKFFNCS